MNRDTIIYCSCTFLLGLIIGAMLIGPHLTKSSPAAPAAVVEGGGAPQSNPMAAVRERLAALKEQVARDPGNSTALAQLGNMYMDAAKFSEASGYYERALAVHDDPNVRVDLGICYKNLGQLEKSLTEFHRAAASSPDQWQPLYNEAIVLAELHRFSEAKTIVARLRQMRPDDADVARLEQAIASAK